ncbi:MAG: tetratricopeptide repeat protein [Nitrospinaceae bacterium]|nr:tetratricopeptide repeat protein [Nitrospinaceae bacterium]
MNRSLGNRKGEGANLSNIGNIHYFRGDLEEALSAYEEALEINREQEHIIGQATILGNLARIYIEMKMFPDATERLRESLEMFRSVGAQTQMKSIQELIEELGAEQE